MTMLVAKGPFILDAQIPGRSKADGFMPAHASCVQVSASRYLVVFGVRGFRGVDDERDIVYQLREGSPDGRILKTACLAQACETPSPQDGGSSRLKMYGTPVVFGVPKHALIQGCEPACHNVFVIKWYTYDKVVQGSRVLIDSQLQDQTLHIEWLQCCLNDAEDDIQIIAPACAMRQQGYESVGESVVAGFEHFCEQPQARQMNHAITSPVQLTQAGDQWVEVDHFNHGQLAAVRYAFNTQTNLYEWVQTGPLLPGRHTEASICKVDGSWLICARSFTQGGQSIWWRADDPFAPWAPGFYGRPATWGPRTLFTCADGVVRIFSGSIAESPYGEKRNPLYCWDVNPKDFSLSNRRVVFDFYERGFYQPNDARLADTQGPAAGFVKLCPVQGSRQMLTHRVVKTTGPTGNTPLSDASEMASFGCHASEFIFDRPPEPAWVFQADKRLA